MAGDTIITVVGNLTADPEMRFTPSGAAVASFTVASTPRTFDRQPRGGGQGGFGGGQGGGFGGNQGGQGGYNQGGPQQGGYNGGGGFGGQGQSGYNAPAGGAADDPWATGGSTSLKTAHTTTPTTLNGQPVAPTFPPAGSPPPTSRSPPSVAQRAGRSGKPASSTTAGAHAL